MLTREDFVGIKWTIIHQDKVKPKSCGIPKNQHEKNPSIEDNFVNNSDWKSHNDMNFEHLEKSTSVETSSGVAKSQSDEASSATAESQTKPERSTPFQKDFPFTVWIFISRFSDYQFILTQHTRSSAIPKKNPHKMVSLYTFFS